jgi:hypothetical protein
MRDSQVRVLQERKEVCEKIEKLGAFIDGETFRDFGYVEKLLLITQMEAMQQYCWALDSRIERT